MKFGNILIRTLAFILAVTAFGFYVFVIVNFTNGSILELPYVILTVYFILCTVIFPFVALEDNKLVEKLRFLPGSSLLLVRFAAAPFILFRERSNNMNEES